jgi:hypothetical protein
MPQQWFRSPIARLYATVRQQSPDGLHHVHENRPLEHLHWVGCIPILRRPDRAPLRDIVPPAVGGTAHNMPSELFRPL